jgi:glucosylceramidase
MKVTLTKTNKDRSFFRGRIFPHSGACDFVIDSDKTYQTIIGFGGAFTEAAAHVYESLSRSLKEEVIKLYFSDDGCRYNLGRVTIGSCDFSLGEYDYSQKDDLSDFSLRHDEREIIPFLLDASKARSLMLLASSWSPCARWKDNNDKCHGGHLKDGAYDFYASYLAQYCVSMEKKGLEISAMTIQNEPEAIQVWESCLFDEKAEGRLAKELHAHNPLVKLYLWDHNRDAIVRRAQNLFADDAVKQSAYGLAYHWYDGDQNAELSIVGALYPDKPLLFTEGCVELRSLGSLNPSSAVGNFDSAIRYARNYILDINYGSTGFIDWNLLLDNKGGPNHVGNYCEAPIMSDGFSLRVNASFYAIKHFSHFIDPGAKRISLISHSDVLGCAIRNPDSSIVVIFLNISSAKSVSFEIDNKAYSCYLYHNELASICIRD